MFSILTVSCDPMSRYLITAKRDSLRVVTYPSLSSIYCHDKNNTEKCKELAKYYESDKETYKINPNESLQIFNTIGGGVSLKEFPIDSIKIEKNNQVIWLKGKRQIFDNFRKNFKSLKVTYEYIP